jgi:hypothetical protein
VQSCKVQSAECKVVLCALGRGSCDLTGCEPVTTLYLHRCCSGFGPGRRQSRRLPSSQWLRSAAQPSCPTKMTATMHVRPPPGSTTLQPIASEGRRLTRIVIRSTVLSVTGHGRSGLVLKRASSLRRAQRRPSISTSR